MYSGSIRRTPAGVGFFLGNTDILVLKLAAVVLIVSLKLWKLKLDDSGDSFSGSISC